MPLGLCHKHFWRTARNNPTFTNSRRRRFLAAASVSFAGLGLGLMTRIVAAETPNAKLGIIGSGHIGSTLGGLWLKAGHEVMFSSLDLAYD